MKVVTTVRRVHFGLTSEGALESNQSPVEKQDCDLPSRRRLVTERLFIKGNFSKGFNKDRILGVCREPAHRNL